MWIRRFRFTFFIWKERFFILKKWIIRERKLYISHLVHTQMWVNHGFWTPNGHLLRPQPCHFPDETVFDLWKQSLWADTTEYLIMQDFVRNCSVFLHTHLPECLSITEHSVFRTSKNQTAYTKPVKKGSKKIAESFVRYPARSDVESQSESM